MLISRKLLYTFILSFGYATIIPAQQKDSSANLPLKHFPKLTLKSLRNASYYIDDMFGDIELKNGFYDMPRKGGQMANEPWYITFNGHVFLDLDGDHNLDAIVVLSQKYGGSGVFKFVIPVLNRNGDPYPLNPFELGDRIGVRSISMKRDTIYIAVITQYENEPLCCGTKKETWRFILKGNDLVMIK